MPYSCYRLTVRAAAPPRAPAGSRQKTRCAQASLAGNVHTGCIHSNSRFNYACHKAVGVEHHAPKISGARTDPAPHHGAVVLRRWTQSIDSFTRALRLLGQEGAAGRDAVRLRSNRASALHARGCANRCRTRIECLHVCPCRWDHPCVLPACKYAR